MAGEVTLTGEQILLKVGDGADPEVFAHPCLINTNRGVAFAAEGNKGVELNCDNPGDPNWTLLFKSSVTATANGAGVLDVRSVADYFDWLQSPDAKNVQIVIGVSADNTGGYFSGAFHLMEFEVTGEEKNQVTCELKLESHGKVTYAAHA